MQEKPKTFRVESLLQMGSQGMLDVPEIQRLFSRGSKWCAELLDSLHRGISLSALLCWQPEARTRPKAGRYRGSSSASTLIVDGQHRVTGLLAALGVQPAWIPAPVWKEMGGPGLETAVSFDAAGTPVFRPAAEVKEGAIRMGAVIDAAPAQIMAISTDAGFAPGIAAQLVDLVRNLKSAEVLVAWLPDDEDAAVLGFERHNRQPKLMLRSEELLMCRLSAVFGPLQREYIDPIRFQVARLGLDRTVSAQRIAAMLRSEVAGASGQRTQASAAQVRAAADRVLRAHNLLLPYLGAHGITSDAVVAAPSLIEVVAHLLLIYPQAASDDFPIRWLTHAVARTLYLTRRTPGVSDIQALRQTGSYAAAQAVLTASMPEPAVPVFGADTLRGAVSKRTFGPAGSLYAMAAARSVDGPVRDLGDARRRFPDAGLALRPLVPKPQRRHLPLYAFTTEQTARVIAEHGGWTPDAYEALGCDADLLRAQHLPEPVPGLRGAALMDWLSNSRIPLITAAINRFLVQVGPMRSATPATVSRAA